MRIEVLQDKLHGNGTLAGGYAVVWNGTRASASGTKYLDADDFRPPSTPAAPVDMRERPTTALVLDWLKSHGPATIRELADALEVDIVRVNSAVASLRLRKAAKIVGYRTMIVEKFGPRTVAIWGLPS